MSGAGFTLIELDESTFGRIRGEEVVFSTINLVWEKEEGILQNKQLVGLIADYKLIWGELKQKEEVTSIRIEREVVDWGRLEGFVKSLKEGGENLQREVYRGIEGDSAYDKFLWIRGHYVKKQRIYGRSKRWWNKELGEQLKIARRVAGGGKG